jgi:hypothetical protein
LGPFTAQLLAKLDAGERLGGMSALDLSLALRHALPPSSPAELLPPPDAVSSAHRQGTVES